MKLVQWLVVVLLVAFGVGAAWEAGIRAEGLRHQDISCTTGVYSFFAEDVAVQEKRGKVLITYPDGRKRAVFEGSCEWGPHDPEGEYEETQSWQGPEPDRGVRWAWRNTRSTSTAGRSLRA